MPDPVPPYRVPPVPPLRPTVRAAPPSDTVLESLLAPDCRVPRLALNPLRSRVVVPVRVTPEPRGRFSAAPTRKFPPLIVTTVLPPRLRSPGVKVGSASV